MGVAKGVAGVVAVVVVMVFGAGTVAPDLMRMVPSSRRVDLRVAGRVPCQPGEEETGRVRNSFWRTAVEGINGDASFCDDLGRRDAKIDRESIIP